MDDSLKRRVTVASCWASSRASVLDRLERYEDSYAITEEFREWITSIGEHPEYLNNSVLKFPNSCSINPKEEANDTDEMIQI